MNPVEYYRRNISIPNGGREIASRLTYCLHPEISEERNVLLTPFHKRFLSPKDIVHWDQLVRETSINLSGNFHQDKFLVKRIRQDPGVFPQLSIAVHHFGPVPVLLTDHYSNQELHGKQVNARVALYYNRTSEGTDQYRSMFPNTLVLLESLMGTYSVVMKRYFEDVAQVLKAIARQSSLPKAFEWCKIAEDFIGMSIQSKLKHSVPGLPEWKQFSLRNLASLDEMSARCSLFDDHHEDIFLAQNFRYTVLFFINELYKHIGPESKNKEYYDRVMNSNAEYDLLQGRGASVNLIENFEVLRILRLIIKLYTDEDIDGLNNMQSNVIWVQGLLEFARFVLNLRYKSLPPEKGRVFISFNQDVDSSEQLKKQITNYYLENYRNKIEVLSVNNIAAGAVFTEAIRTCIWQSDRIFVIVPSDPSKPGKEHSGDYKWLAREAEHAMLLDKKVIYLTEEGFNDEAFRKALSDEDMHFLSPDAVVEHDRTQRLLKDYNDTVRVSFSRIHNKPEAPWQDLKERMLEALKYNGDHAIAQRHHSMMKGYLLLFPENTLITLKYLYGHIPEGGIKKNGSVKKKGVDDILYDFYGRNFELPFTTKSKARDTFTSAWEHLKARSFIVGANSYTLMTKTDKHDYKITINDLLRALQPDISDERVHAWAEKLLNEVVPLKAKTIQT